jgi:hypothetical protein
MLEVPKENKKDEDEEIEEELMAAQRKPPLPQDPFS